MGNGDEFKTRVMPRDTSGRLQLARCRCLVTVATGWQTTGINVGRLNFRSFSVSGGARPSE